MRKTIGYIGLVTCLLCVWLAPDARAQGIISFRVDEKLLDELQGLQLYDYAELQLAEMTKRYPRNKDQLDLLKAKVLLAGGKGDQARRLLLAIPKDASAYDDALLMLSGLAEGAERRNLLKKYLDSKTGGKVAEDDVSDILTGISQYADVLVKLDEQDKVEQALTYLGKLPQGGDAEQRKLQFIGAELRLQIADSQKQAGAAPEVYKKSVDQAFTMLNRLIFNLDYYAAQAYGELMHVHLLRDDLAKAQELLPGAYEFCKPIEEGLIKQGTPAAFSPIARLLYYRGHMYEMLAEQTAKKDAQKQHLIAAAQSYNFVMQKYSQSKFATLATAGFDRVGRTLNDQHGVSIKVEDKGQQQKQAYDLAVAAFKTGNFPDAATRFLNAYRTQPGSQTAADSLFWAAISMYKDDRLWEAKAMAHMLYQRWPEYEKTHTALYNVGVQCSNAGSALRKKGQVEQADKLADDANFLWTLFVQKAPRHPQAPKVAKRVASSQFRKADRLRQRKQEMEARNAPVAEVNDVVREMREAYMAAAPLYQSVAENYGQTQEGIDAYYFLGWCYYIADRLLDAANAFDQYAAAEERIIPNRVEAIALAADALFRADQPEEAREHYQTIIDWDQADKLPDDDKAKRYAQIAYGRMPWCYEKLADKLLGQRESLGATLRRLEAEEASGQTTEVVEGEAAAFVLTPAIVKEQIAQLEATMEETRKAGIAAFQEYIREHPGNEEFTPPNMLKLGITYAQQGQFEEAANVLNELQARFGHTAAGKQALFSLMRALLRTGQTARAQDIGQKMAGQITSYEIGQLSFLAESLVEWDPRQYEYKALDAELALRANQELLRRAGNQNHPDHQRLKNRQESILYRMAACYFSLGNVDKVVETADKVVELNPSSAYTWQLSMLKGLAQEKAGKKDAALETFNDILRFIDKREQEASAYWATVESARLLLEKRTFEAAKDALMRLRQITTFADKETVSDETALPLMEEGYYYLARAHALLGEDDKARAVIDEYRRLFPNGIYDEEIGRLPGPI